MPRAAYIHIPFCRHHCGYCNFTVIAGRDDLADRYLDGIEAELQWRADHGDRLPTEVDTLYVGGGTPTRLTTDQLARLFDILSTWFPCSSDKEFTIEANPGDIDADKVRVLVDGGVNRVSLGVQSFRAAKLQALDRDHTASDVSRAVELLAGNISALAIDLIFAAPGETLAEWHDELASLIALAPQHVSTYGLTYERGTKFWGQRHRGQLEELDEDLQRSMYLDTIERLEAAGWEQYEVSNFAHPGCRSRHNETYWLGGRYAGIGAGASRFVANERATNHRSTTTYLKRVLAGEDPTEERETLSVELQARERLIFGLRRREGVDLDRIARDLSIDLKPLVSEPLAKFIDLGLLEQTGSQLRLTQAGLVVSDAIWPELLDRC